MHFCYFSTPDASTHFFRVRPIRCKYGWRNLRLILYVHKKVIESFKWVLKSCKNGTFWLGIKTFILASFDFKFFTKVHFYKILKMRERFACILKALSLNIREGNHLKTASNHLSLSFILQQTYLASKYFSIWPTTNKEQSLNGYSSRALTFFSYIWCQLLGKS